MTESAPSQWSAGTGVRTPIFKELTLRAWVTIQPHRNNKVQILSHVPHERMAYELAHLP